MGSSSGVLCLIVAMNFIHKCRLLFTVCHYQQNFQLDFAAPKFFILVTASCFAKFCAKTNVYIYWFLAGLCHVIHLIKRPSIGLLHSDIFHFLCGKFSWSVILLLFLIVSLIKEIFLNWCTHEANFIIWIQNFCKACNGEKVLRGPKTVKLDIMAGILNV